MQRQNLVESFNAAIEGFIYVLKSQRNMRLHFLLGFFALSAGIFLNFSYLELILLCLTIALVLISEMFNTAIEHTIDLLSQDFHPLARIVKDIAAGAVLLGAVAATVVGYVLFVSRVSLRLEDNIIKIRHSNWHITFIALITVMVVVILSKIILNKGTPLRGGMPSGHSAVAFSIWATVSLLYPNSLVIFLVLILALLIAASRVRSGIHTSLEVLMGGAGGALVTLLIFQVLRK